MGTLIGSTFRNTLCAAFNGVDEVMYVDDPAWKSNTEGSISMWIRLNATLSANEFQSVFSIGERNAGNDSTLFFGPRRVTTTGTGTYFNITCRTTNGGQVHGYSATTTALSAGVWYHVVVNSTGGFWTIAINNVAQTLTNWYTGAGSNNTGDWFGDISGSAMRVAIGSLYRKNVYTANYFGGRIDELIVVDRALTGTEITALYNSGTPRNPHRLFLGSNLKAWYRFGDSRDSATTVYDEIASANLTLVYMDATNYIAP